MALGIFNLEIKEYLQKNLEISLTKSFSDYDEGVMVKVEIILEGEVVSEDCEYIYKGDFE